MSKVNNIMVAVSGGIAVYKIPNLISLLKKDGFNVYTAMTEAAQKFVTPLTFAAISGNKVQTDIFSRELSADKESLFPHLYPAHNCEIFILAPATAESIARIAGGHANDIVSASVLALNPGVIKVFCPAMNANMWNNPAVRDNVCKLKNSGWLQIGPEEGIQACGDLGPGRLTEPADIYSKVKDLIKKKAPLSNRKVLILSGPTREYIDPVRFISNASSGLMGKALVETALNEGASVDLITGPVDIQNIPEKNNLLNIHPIETAAEMLSKAKNLSADADAVIFCAAVADYSPQNSSVQKIPGRQMDLSISLKPNSDIASVISSSKKETQIMIGFALESDPDKSLENAEDKLKRKNLDAIMLNSPSSLNALKGEFTFLENSNEKISVSRLGNTSKDLAAGKIISFISQSLSESL